MKSSSFSIQHSSLLKQSSLVGLRAHSRVAAKRSEMISTMPQRTACKGQWKHYRRQSPRGPTVWAYRSSPRSRARSIVIIKSTLFNWKSAFVNRNIIISRTRTTHQRPRVELDPREVDLRKPSSFSTKIITFSTYLAIFSTNIIFMRNSPAPYCIKWMDFGTKNRHV